ncbi:MAG: DUF1778 domain-containing protein [Mariprofundaceae bacterium]
MTGPRISARVTPETRDLVHTAADIKGVSVTDFLAASAVEEAHRVIEQERFVSVSSQYADSFFAALKTPPKPNKTLRRAIKEHRSV